MNLGQGEGAALAGGAFGEEGDLERCAAVLASNLWLTVARDAIDEVVQLGDVGLLKTLPV